MDDRIARGVNFLYAKEFILQEYGAAVWDRTLARLPGDAAGVWGGPLLMIGTYSFSAFKAITVALAAETGGRSDERLARMYEYIADRSLNALYKVFFRLTNPSFVVSNYPRLWSRFFTAGKVEVSEARPGGAVVRFFLPPIFLDWLPAACLGYSTKAVTMAGGRSLSMTEVHRAQQAGGDWAVTFQLRWQE